MKPLVSLTVKEVDDLLNGQYQRGKPVGTRKLKADGYVLIKVTEGRPWEAEHRLVMEKKLGRKMVKGESVHHKDGNRSNNDPSNLELWVGGIRSGQRATEFTCPHCGKPYLESE